MTEQINQRHQKDLQRLRGFRLLDDDFLTKCFEEDTASIELVLQIVLEKPDLRVLTSPAQTLRIMYYGTLADRVRFFKECK